MFGASSLLPGFLTFACAAMTTASASEPSGPGALKRIAQLGHIWWDGGEDAYALEIEGRYYRLHHIDAVRHHASMITAGYSEVNCPPDNGLQRISTTEFAYNALIFNIEQGTASVLLPNRWRLLPGTRFLLSGREMLDIDSMVITQLPFELPPLPLHSIPCWYPIEKFTSVPLAHELVWYRADHTNYCPTSTTVPWLPLELNNYHFRLYRLDEGVNISGWGIRPVAFTDKMILARDAYGVLGRYDYEGTKLSMTVKPSGLKSAVQLIDRTVLIDRATVTIDTPDAFHALVPFHFWAGDSDIPVILQLTLASESVTPPGIADAFLGKRNAGRYMDMNGDSVLDAADLIINLNTY